MSLPLPVLDDRTYADLVAELRALIPSLSPDWTDHNPADPGITMLELAAWLTEMLLYRVDRVPDETVRTFLRLLNGPSWAPGPDLAEDIRATILDLRLPYRAVTEEDYETLARQVAGVARARCVPRRNLGASSAAGRAVPRPGWISLIAVPAAEVTAAGSLPGAPRPTAALLSAVAGYFEPRRLLTVRQAVAGPFYSPIAPEVVLARRPDALPGTVLQAVVAALNGWLDPRAGGPAGEGWPFGRDVFVSEIYQLLEAVPGVDYVADVGLSSQCPGGSEEFCETAGALWHDSGDLIGLALGAHLLPWPQVDAKHIVVGSVFAPVRLTVHAPPAAAGAAAQVRRDAKAAVRLLFHPLHGGPDGHAARWIAADAIEKALGAPGVKVTAKVEVEGGSGPPPPGQGAGPGVWIAEGELADLSVEVEFS